MVRLYFVESALCVWKIRALSNATQEPLLEQVLIRAE